MKTYVYEGAWQIDQLVIVGTGGTGSALARIAARLLWQRQQLGQTVPTLHLIDPDVVEAKNVGRQGGFSPADIGGYKAEILARRYSLALGLPIVWSNEAFDADQHLPHGSVLIGCVDNHLARQTLVAAAEGVTYLDCGNARTHGQVVLGSTASREKVMTTLAMMEQSNNEMVPCRHLPNIALLYPELLEPEPPTVQPALSCAELVMAEEQHVLINDAIALVAGQYLYKLLHRDPLTTFMTTLDLHHLALESHRIDPVVLRHWL